MRKRGAYVDWNAWGFVRSIISCYGSRDSWQVDARDASEWPKRSSNCQGSSQGGPDAGGRRRVWDALFDALKIGRQAQSQALLMVMAANELGRVAERERLVGLTASRLLAKAFPEVARHS